MPAVTSPNVRNDEQMALFEDPPDEVIEELQALALKKKSLLKRRRKSSGKYGSSVAKFLSVELAQQELDFGDVSSKSKKEVNPFHYTELTEGDVIRIHMRVLKHMYKLLNDKRTSNENREWVIDWVMEPLLHPPERANRERPLSLQACANAYGVRADRLQMIFLSRFGLHHLMDDLDWVDMSPVEEAVFSRQYWCVA